MLKSVIEPRTAGLPQDEGVTWVSMSAPQIAREMAKEGCDVSEYLVRQMLEHMESSGPSISRISATRR